MTDHLDYLDKVTARPGMKWVARYSTTGRGFRLHQTRNPEGFKEVDASTGDTPTEALANWLSRQVFDPTPIERFGKTTRIVSRD